MNNQTANQMIDRLRISFVSGEAFTEILENKDVYPFSFLRAKGLYKKQYKRAKAYSKQLQDGAKAAMGEPKREELRLPWEVRPGSRFWFYYLGAKTLEDVSGATAWRFNVPLRLGPLARIHFAQLGQVRARSECFYFPFGLAQVLTLDIGESLSLSDMIDLAIDLTGERMATVEWGETTEQQVKFNTLSKELFKRYRRFAIGEAVVDGLTSARPFTISTVVKGAEEFADSNKIAEGGIIHRSLEGLVSRIDNWKDFSPLPSLEERRLPLGLAQSSDFLYGNRRGRAVWFPRRFQPDNSGGSMACYHRNLVLAAALVEMVCLFCRKSNQIIKSGGDLGPTHRSVLRLAAQNLANLYQGENSSYRTNSAKHHIDKSPWFEDVNEIWSRFDLA